MNMLGTKGLAALAAALLSSAAVAQGTFDFGRIPGISAEPTVQIDLTPTMLAILGAAAGAREPTAADALAGIQGVRVYVYEQIENAAAVRDFIDDSSGRLERDGWERILFVQEDEERVRIYSKIDDSRITGLTLMVVDPSEAVFINIAGEITPAQLARLMSEFGMDDVLSDLAVTGVDGNHAP